MLVFLSDLHLIDNPRRNLKPGAFRKFTSYLKSTVEKSDADIKSVEVVLLGDIFDPLKSNLWHNTTLRPWSEEGECDLSGKSKRRLVGEIVNNIVTDPQNVESLSILSGLKNQLDVPVKMTYIMGNHDRLINLYPEVRMQVAKALGMHNPFRFEFQDFPLEKVWKDYRTVARHGNSFDKFNPQSQSSIGDAIVIDLIGKFPKLMAKDNRADEHVLGLLEEIEFVRPYVDVPQWLESLSLSDSCCKSLVKSVFGCWNDLIDEFLRIDFIREQTKDMWLLRRAIQFGLKTAGRLAFHKYVLRACSKMFMSNENGYDKHASEEASLDNDTDFVVYGHTHKHTLVPLRKIEGKPKIYFNTGTWTKVHMKDVFGDQVGFQSWQVMSFVNIFNNERKHRFEVWNGSLG